MARKIKAIFNDNGVDEIGYLETVGEQVLLKTEGGGTIRLDELLDGYADEINKNGVDIADLFTNKLDKTAQAADSTKVNGLTVETAVPAGAKFTDTVYTPPSVVTQAEAEAGTSTTVYSWTPQMVAIAAESAAKKLITRLHPLHSYTWEQIAAISSTGEANKFLNIGDEKDITLTTGEVLTLQIYGFNHDDLTAGGKAGITFGLKNLMAGRHPMNESGTNVGGFTGSEMYGWLSGTFFNSLPSDLKGLIKAVDKRTSAGNASSTIQTDSMKVFLFSRAEVINVTSGIYEGEGTRYPIFTDNASRMKRWPGDSEDEDAGDWWLRSPRSGSTTGFNLVTGDIGNCIGINASYSTGVAPGFCI